MHAIVIGAGIIGLTTAFELTERGCSVSVVDPDPVSAATHFAGGMLAPVAEVQYCQDPLYPLMLSAARAWPSLLERVGAFTDKPLGFRDEGTLVVAGDRADAQHLKELTEHQQAHGMQVERITVRQARDLEPALSPGIAGAVSIPGDHQVAPRIFAQGLIDALARRGVEFVLTAARHFDCDDQGRVHHISGDDETAEICGDTQIVVSCGLGAADISGWQARPALALRPVYGDILIVRAPGLIDRVIRGFVEDRPVYIIPRPDGTVAIGATTREDERPDTPVGCVRDLLADACRIVPGLEEAGMVEWGTGARPGTPDDLPYLGRVSPNLVVSTGYFRHGILLSALGAAAGADLATGARPADADLLTACDPLRHQERTRTQS